MQIAKSQLIVHLLRPLLHTIMIRGMYRIAYTVRMDQTSLIGRDIGTSWVAVDELKIYAVLSSLIFIVIGIVNNRYNIINHGLYRSKNFLKTWGQRMVIVTCLAYFGQERIFQYGISRYIIIQTTLSVLIAIPLIDGLWHSVLDRIFIQHKKHVLLLYQTKAEQDISQTFKLSSQYVIEEKIRDLTDINDIHHDVIVLIGSWKRSVLQNIIEHTRLSDQLLYHIGDNHFLEDIVYLSEQIGGIPAIRYTPSQIEGRSHIIKRGFDLVGSTIGIILTSPLMLITALSIKLNSSGPIFYTQQRVGKNGKNFTFIKFRSMYTHLSVGEKFGGNKAQQLYQDLVNSHANIRQGELPKIKNDPRVTSIGKFIRATSIDELPNLFSVWIGDMSLVGPRPHLPSEIANYKPRQKRVLSIKPGITGYAQIHGRDTISFDEEATKELEYIQNRSLRLDIYIIFATIGVIFGGRGK